MGDRGGEGERLEMLVGMPIEILNGGEILINSKFKLNQNLHLNLYREIQRNSNSIKISIRFVPRDTERFEFLYFDQLTKISPTFRIWIRILRAVRVSSSGP